MFRLQNVKRLLKEIQSEKQLKILMKYESTQVSQSQNNSDQPTVGKHRQQDEVNINTKFQRKLPARKPLLKNFFLGNVDKEMLAYPEPISRDDMTKLHNDIININKYFEDDLDARKIEATRCVPKDVLNELKRLGVFGLNASQHMNGKGYFWSESLIASEKETISSDLTKILLSHRLIVDVLMKYGSDYQKDKYIARLADGSIIGADAIYESKSSESGYFNTFAEYEETTNDWTLTGEKSFVVGGGDPNLLMVFAQTKSIKSSGEIDWTVAIFLVDTKLPGVKIEKNLLSFGCAGAQFCTVNFNKVNLSPDCVLVSKEGKGNEIAQYILRSQRIRLALLGLGMTKNIINEMTEYCIKTKTNGTPLIDLQINTHRLSQMVCDAYAMESMIYFTTGLMDEFDNQDVDLEAAITKLFAMEKLWSAAHSNLNFRGPNFIAGNQDGSSFIQNAAQVYTHGESVDSLKLFAVLCGIQHAGISMYEDIKKQRNPLFHPKALFSKFIQLDDIDNPRSKLKLEEHLHPTLMAPATCLEHSIVRLKMCTDILFTRYGNEIIEKHADMLRLAEMITLIYSTFTSLARASRSYCIGLYLSDHEMLIATSIALEAHERIKVLAHEINQGGVMTTDINYNRLYKQIVKSKGYFSVHPLTFNY